MSEFYGVSVCTAFQADERNPRNSEGSVIELKGKSLLMAWQCFEAGEQGSADGAMASLIRPVLRKMLYGYFFGYTD